MDWDPESKIKSIDNFTYNLINGIKEPVQCSLV